MMWNEGQMKHMHGYYVLIFLMNVDYVSHYVYYVSQYTYWGENN